MKELTEEIIDEICIVCLNNGDTISIYDNEKNEKFPIHEMLSYCTHHKFTGMDGFPTKICNSCLEELHNFYKFTKKIEYSFTILTEYKNNAKIEHVVIKSENIEIKSENIDIQNENMGFENESTNIKNENSNSIVGDDSVELVFDNVESKIEDSQDFENFGTEITNEEPEPIKDEVPLPEEIVEGCEKTKNYNCKRCSIEFQKYEELAEHRKDPSHLQPKRNCKICGKMIVNKSMSLHLRLHTQERRYPCKICDKKFFCSGNLRRHNIQKHSETKPYNCTLCFKGYATPSRLREHMRIHTGEKPFVCNFCGKGFAENSFLKRHLNIHTRQRDNKNNDVSIDDVKIFPCEVCNRTFPSKSLLNAHSIVHGEKKFLCPVCGAGFIRKQTYLNHLEIHSEEKKYECEICNKKFSHKNSFYTHKAVHSDNKKFICSVCGKQFKYSSHLNNHIRKLHRGEKYSCEFCKKNFTDKAYLNIHKRIHTGETPHVCEICNKGFYDPSNLKKHRKCHEKSELLV